MDAFGNLDSKYRFIILASKRAKQLLKGAKPKLATKSKSLIRIAQAEVKSGLVDFEIIPTHMDDLPEREERVFVGAGIAEEAADSESFSGKDVVEGEEGVEIEEGAEEEEAGEEDVENGAEKDDKDE